MSRPVAIVSRFYEALGRGDVPVDQLAGLLGVHLEGAGVFSRT